MKRRLERIAEAKHQAPEHIVQEAIRDYVLREERREQFREDTLVSWKEYEASGMHLTGEDLDGWVAELEQNPKAGIPQCHK